MRFIVCGGRGYLDCATAFARLDELDAQCGVSCVIEGGARGADSLGRLWAIKRGRAVQTFKADWAGEGKAAGAARNARMIAEGKPDGVLAFPGSYGTADMVRKAKAAGLLVWQPVD